MCLRRNRQARDLSTAFPFALRTETPLKMTDVAGIYIRSTRQTNERQLMGGFNLQDLMSKAKSQYDTLQKKMQETVVEASSGGGTVTAKMDGRKQLLSLRIDPEAVKSGDVEMLQDLVLAAINEAARKIDAALQSSLGGMLGGLGIPGL
jgi:DNA-binding YbaB/EbfC family protein